jgi:hypothetical protein
LLNCFFGKFSHSFKNTNGRIYLIVQPFTRIIYNCTRAFLKKSSQLYNTTTRLIYINKSKVFFSSHSSFDDWDDRRQATLAASGRSLMDYVGSETRLLFTTSIVSTLTVRKIAFLAINVGKEPAKYS